MITAPNQKVVHIGVTPRQRAGNKLSSVHTSPKFTRLLDALLDIRPRRTRPHGLEAIITPDNDVVVVDERSEATYIGSFDDLSKNLHGIAQMAELDAEELAAVYEAVEEARIGDD